MASQQEGKPEQGKPVDNKNITQQNKKDQGPKSSNEDKFTWKPGDVKVYDSVSEIPGFQPFPVKAKKKVEKKKDGA